MKISHPSEDSESAVGYMLAVPGKSIERMEKRWDGSRELNADGEEV